MGVLLLMLVATGNITLGPNPELLGVPECSEVGFEQRSMVEMER